MKRILSLLIMLLVAVCSFSESKCKFDPKAYKAEQRRYITQKAGLTQPEAQIFFKLYDEMRSEERKLYNKIKFDRKRHPQTEEECYKAIVEKDRIEISLKKIQQQYHQKMLKALPAKVVLKCLHFAEHFDRKKLREGVARPHRKKN